MTFTREGVLYDDTGAMVVTLGSGATIPSATFTSPTITNPTVSGIPVGIPYVLAQCGIPFIKASSGTMGNNGALSGLTALPTTYAKAFIWLPAGAIAAGVPAAATWYYVQMSSTT